jgi:hypothetical protein
VIGRAGASSIAEPLAFGRPLLLIPFGAAMEGHQDANARAMVETERRRSACARASSTGDRFTAQVSGLIDNPDRLQRMANAARAAGRPQAALRSHASSSRWEMRLKDPRRRHRRRGDVAIAKLLLAAGHGVTGSDNGRWPLAEALARHGAAVHERFAAENVPGTDVVLRSSAYKEDNVEVAEALPPRHTGVEARGRVAFPREEESASSPSRERMASRRRPLSSGRRSGQGRGCLAHLWAVLRGLGSNAHAGSSDVLVIEADEYDNTFTRCSPSVAVVTTVDHDHVDMFPTRESYRDTFRVFVAVSSPPGRS